MLVIDNEKFIESDKKIRTDVTGPLLVTTKHIPEVPFTYETPICYLTENQRLVFDVVIRKGKAKQHIKWRPVSSVSLKEADGKIKISYKNIGMLSDKNIIERAVLGMKDSANQTPQTIFSKVVL
jgi:DNA-directed RNA polymerase alpha subunit